MNFKEQMEEKTAQIEEVLKSFLPKEEGFQKTVIEAMNYSLLAGGKRLRPMFMQETFRLYGGKGREIEYFMAAIEMIHTYSLVHDDLPAMDNDEYRRGRKTTHVVYGEAQAILAGDALLNYAFETATAAFDVTKEPVCVGRALQLLARKSGIYGMIGGQCVDVESEGQSFGADRLQFIHSLKTGALLEASCMLGAVLAGADAKEIARMERVASDVGMAFQIQDDILDITGTMQQLGKPVHSDEKNQKVTYVSVHGMEQAKRAVKELSERALEELVQVNGDTQFLQQLIEALIYRQK